jgi:BlaI family penicillinase repressor
MSKPRFDVTDAELAVLQELWDRGPSSIRGLASRLYTGDEATGYATVQKLLERLERKSCVRRERGSPAHLFHATAAREDLIDGRIAEVADKLCGGSVTPILLHLIEATRLSKKDRELLRKLLEEEAGG